MNARCEGMIAPPWYAAALSAVSTAGVWKGGVSLSITVSRQGSHHVFDRPASQCRHHAGDAELDPEPILVDSVDSQVVVDGGKEHAECIADASHVGETCDSRTSFTESSHDEETTDARDVSQQARAHGLTWLWWGVRQRAHDLGRQGAVEQPVNHDLAIEPG